MFHEVLGVIPVPAFSQWLDWQPRAVSRGLSALHCAQRCLLQSPSVCFLSPAGAPGHLYSKATGLQASKKNLPDLLRARPGTGSVTAGRPDLAGVSCRHGWREGLLAAVYGGCACCACVRVAHLEPRCTASPGPSCFHSQMNFL